MNFELLAAVGSPADRWNTFNADRANSQSNLAKFDPPRPGARSAQIRLIR
jgi:hypothetical protein